MAGLEHSAGLSAGPLRVLIADDSPEIRTRLVALLGGLEGVRIIGEAGTVPAALDQVASARPDVVVTDLEMPGGSGLDMLRRIRRDFPGTRVIMLTNHATSYFREATLAAGASFFFDKSIEFAWVRPAVEHLASQKF